MKLEEFVRQTLLDITNGVAAAKAVAPYWIAPGRVEGRKNSTPQLVKFEVSVTTSKEAGGGVSIWSAVEGKAAASSEHANRISFEVPIYLQAPTEQKVE